MSEGAVSRIAADECGSDDLDRILSAGSMDHEPALTRRASVPAARGVYPWCFDQLPGDVDSARLGRSACMLFAGATES